MLRLICKALKHNDCHRYFSTTNLVLHRVSIIGSAGGIGQALAMLMKADRLVTDMSLMDIQNVDGIGADISHIDTLSGVQWFSGKDKMGESLRCSNLVIVTAGAARKEGETRAGLFDANKDLIAEVAALKAQICPKAFLVIVTNPINALVPLAAEILKQAKAYDARKLFGVTKLDTVRAKTFIGDYGKIDPYKINCTVIGGHSAGTIVPIISKASPALKGDCDELEEIYKRIRTGGDAVVKAHKGKKSAQLSIAYATATFCHSLLEAMSGKSGVIDVAYTESNVCPEVTFFSGPMDLGKEGVKKLHDMPEMNKYETELLEKAIPELKKSIEQGIKYAESKKGDQKKEEKKC